MEITEMLMEPVDDGTRAILFAGGFVLFLLAENLFPLRAATQPKVPRLVRNLVLAGIGTLFVRIAVLGGLVGVASWSADHRFGLLPFLNLPGALDVVVGILLMDYTFYHWHRWNHKNRFLWRFHNVHHTDMDLDVSTAARFHIGELALSAPYRAAQIVVIGVTPATWILFEVLVVASTQFHHANIRLPEVVDRFLSRFIVTPRMHGLHHSQILGETDSNYSTIFSFWDRIHRSFSGNVPQFFIGVPSYQDPGELTLFRLLALPFRRPRDWRRPDGEVPQRPTD